MPPKAAPKAPKAAPKPRKGSKAVAAAPAAPAPPDPPVTPPPRPRGRAGLRGFETPGEQFPPVSPDSSDEDTDTAAAGDVFAPPVLISPIKRRQRQAAPTINRLTDLEVWDMSDEEIVDAARMSWRSEVYDHYDVTLRRNFTEAQEPLSMTLIFTCKTHPQNHTSVRTRLRGKSGDGTSNLQKDVDTCLRKQGRERVKPAPAAISYSEAAHCALIALRCAKNARPINSVLDEDYKLEVEMLRPGTKLPSPMTVQRDLLYIYEQASIAVKNYFLQLNSTIHLVLDGWTSLLVSSYLGLVVVWFDQGVIHRAILEFIRLTKKHDGRYLATVTSECLKRFGLDQQLLGLCMDNASNCDKLAELLSDYIPTFWGMDARLRCLAHIINLVAKIFISFFFKKPKVKKSITIASDHRNEEVELVVDPGDGSDEGEEDSAATEQASIEAEETQEDDGQVAHDDAVVKSLWDVAIREMKDQGVVMSEAEKQMALKLFPAVSGLARRVHDSSPLNEKFQELIDQDPELSSTKRALDRRVPTRWNSDFDCLAAHLHFRDVIEALTGVSGNKLQAYRLSEEQWELADDVQEVLKLFKDVTLLFSQAEVPLIVDALPMLFHLQDSLKAVVLDQPQNDDDASDDDSDLSSTSGETPAVIRIAAHAGVLLIEKYMDLTWDCEIYVISIVMCPDRKLQFLKDYVSSEKLKEIKKMVINRWSKTYAPAQSQIPVAKKNTKEKSKWAAPSSASSGSSKYPADSIQAYLAESVASSDAITDAGGYMKYWYQMRNTRPGLSRMGQAFCSAPATSVDAERAFSTGRRQVNHMQHNMSSQTFKARVALGSWAKTPIFPKYSDIAAMVESCMGE